MSGTVEKSFESFESMLLGSKVDRTEVLEWRARTIGCAAVIDGKGLQRIDQVGPLLWRILSPILITGPRGDRPEVCEDIKKELYDICSKALKLALRFRRSKAQYAFRIFERDTKVGSCEDEAKPVRSVGKMADPFVQNETFVYSTLFGALIKTRNPLSAEGAHRIVLRKAQVAVFDPRWRTG